MSEATTYIKINKPLEAAGWRFFAEDNGPANIRPGGLEGLGADFEKTEKGFVDFLSPY